MFQFIAKINDNGTAKTIRGKIDTDDAVAAISQGVAKLPGTLKEAGLEASSVGTVMVKRMSGQSSFTVSTSKSKAKDAAKPAAKKSGRR